MTQTDVRSYKVYCCIKGSTGPFVAQQCGSCFQELK